MLTWWESQFFFVRGMLQTITVLGTFESHLCRDVPRDIKHTLSYMLNPISSLRRVHNSLGTCMVVPVSMSADDTPVTDVQHALALALLPLDSLLPQAPTKLVWEFCANGPSWATHDLLENFICFASEHLAASRQSQTYFCATSSWKKHHFHHSFPRCSASNLARWSSGVVSSTVTSWL